MGSAVIGSGVHVAMVAMIDNASGIRKAFMNLLSSSIFTKYFSEFI